MFNEGKFHFTRGTSYLCLPYLASRWVSRLPLLGLAAINDFSYYRKLIILNDSIFIIIPVGLQPMSTLILPANAQEGCRDHHSQNHAMMALWSRGLCHALDLKGRLHTWAGVRCSLRSPWILSGSLRKMLWIGVQRSWHFCPRTVWPAEFRLPSLNFCTVSGAK